MELTTFQEEVTICLDNVCIVKSQHSQTNNPLFLEISSKETSKTIPVFRSSNFVQK